MVQIDMDMPKSCVDCPCANTQDGWCLVHNEVLERMENGYPSTEIRPEWCPIKETKHGKWLKISPAGIYECSECHQNVKTGDIEVYLFCHHCGVRMDGFK